ncbi:MAG: DUF4350 domain-containing protein [Chloroflexi bacterium]|nr:DUF4350 domain-containing protein [Chloroflexota bacterium]
MRILRLVALSVAVILPVSWLSIVFYPSAQDFMKTNPFWNGVRDFSNRYQAEVTSTLDKYLAEPKGSVLIEIPYVPYDSQQLQQLVAFVGAGGTLVVMDDFGYGNQVLQALGSDMEFSGAPLLDPYLSYRNLRFPQIADLAPELKGLGIDHLTLNNATALNVRGPYQILAQSSDTSFLDTNNSATWDEWERKGPFTVVASTRVANGTVVAVSDPSILINSMVERGDNGTFMKWAMGLAAGNTRVAIDASHLTKAPLDRSKETWGTVRERLDSPYSQVLLVGAIMSLTLIPMWRKGANFDQGQ